MSKRVSIVFEETGVIGRDEHGHSTARFNVFLEGFPVEERRKPQDQYTPAEFWGFKMFAIVIDILQRCGVVDQIINAETKKEQH